MLHTADVFQFKDLKIIYLIFWQTVDAVPHKQLKLKRDTFIYAFGQITLIVKHGFFLLS